MAPKRERERGSSSGRRGRESGGKRYSPEPERSRRRSRERERERKGPPVVVTSRQSATTSSKRGANDESSGGEEGASEVTSQEKFDLENISDEEFEYVDGAGEIELTTADEEMLTEIVAAFDPNKFDLKPFRYFHPPWLFPCAIEGNDENGTSPDPKEAALESWNLLRETVSNTQLADKYQSVSAEWVEAMEKLLPKLPLSLKALELAEPRVFASGLAVLSSWLTYGLDMEEARMQSQPAFIIRHIKVGLRLATALTTATPTVCRKMIELDIQHRILDLIEHNDKVPTIVLQILKALDSSIFYKEGMEAFLKQECLCYEGGPLMTPYERLTKYMKKTTNSRVLVAMRALLRKLWLYETVISLKEEISNFIHEEESEECVIEDYELTDKQAKSISHCISQLFLTYRNAPELIGVNRFQLPVSKIYEIRTPREDPYPALYQMLKTNGVLESLTVLCCHGGGGGGKRVMTVVRQFFDEFLNSLHGLLFFACQTSVSQNLLQVLLHQDSNGDGDDSSPLRQFGLEFVHHLNALQQVDILLSIRKKCSADPYTYIDNGEAVSALQQLMKLSYTFTGRRHVVKVLSWNKNMDSILPFVELTGDPEVDSKARKSACAAYAADLLLMSIRCSDSVEMLQTFSDRLLAVSDFSVNSVDYLCENVNSYVSDGISPQPPKRLIVVLRILRSLIDVARVDSGVDKTKELKHRQALLLMYSKQDTFSSLIQLLTKLVDSQLINWQQGLSMNNQDGQIFYACVLPTLSIVRATVTELILVRKQQFRDLTVIRPLVHLFTVCCTLLPAQGSAQETRKIQTDVVQTLLAFTQPIATDSEENNNSAEKKSVEKSLWIRMIKEILDYRQEAPYAFVGATTVLAELLPIPLPIQSVEELTEEDVKMATANREAWSAHLEPLEDQISKLMGELVESTHPALQNSTRRLALWLADLTPRMARIVARAVLNSVLHFAETPRKYQHLRKYEKEDSTAEEKKIDKRLQLPVSSALTRVLDTAAYLCSQAQVKITVLSLLRSQQELDECYAKLLVYFPQILNYRSSESAHNRCKELIVSMLLQFCDYEISLLGSSLESRKSLETLVSSLPSKEQLKEICCMLLRHVGDATNGFQITVVPSLRALLMIIEHDYGLHLFREALLEESGSLCLLLRGIIREFSVKSPSCDCLSSLNMTMELIRSLLHLPQTEEQTDSESETDQIVLRKRVLTKLTVRNVLEWIYGGKKNNLDHPLIKLADLLQQSVAEDETMNSYLEPVRRTVSLLADDSIDTIAEFEAVVVSDRWSIAEFPDQLDLECQFEQRAIWVLVSEIEDVHHHLAPHYWFPPCPAEEMLEEDNEEPTGVKCDLESLRQEILPQFDPKEDLLKRVSTKHVERPTKRPKHGRPVIINTSRGKKKLQAVPVRGRGFIPRGHVAQRMNDPFRNRPQNTSRAPSMHVDDFLIMESQSKADPVAPKSSRSDRSSRSRSRNVRSGERRTVKSKSPVPGVSKEIRGGNRRGGGIRGGHRGSYSRSRERDYRSRLIHVRHSSRREPSRSRRRSR